MLRAARTRCPRAAIVRRAPEGGEGPFLPQDGLDEEHAAFCGHARARGDAADALDVEKSPA